jgi:hypothetical protein
MAVNLTVHLRLWYTILLAEYKAHLEFSVPSLTKEEVILAIMKTKVCKCKQDECMLSLLDFPLSIVRDCKL